MQSFLQSTTGLDILLSKFSDLLCFPCYKYYNSLVKASANSLSNEAIIAKLKEKETNLVHTCESLGDRAGDSVQLALYKTALHVCRIALSDQAFLFPDVYRVFLQSLPEDVDVSVSISKSRLLTFLGNEFADLLTSFCHNKRVGTVFYRAKADMSACYGYK